MKQLLNIQGLWCASCEASALRCLEKIDGVYQARVSFVLGAGMVEYDEKRIGIDDICQRLKRLGYQSHPKDSDVLDDHNVQLQKHLMRLVIAIFFGMWVMVFQISHYLEPNPYAGWGGFLGSLPILLYSGWPILRIGWRTLFQATPTLDSLISIALVASTLLSIPSLYSPAEPWWDTVAMLVIILLIGRLLEMKLRRQSLQLQQTFQHNLEPELERIGDNKRVPLSEIGIDDIICIHRDMVFPIDCTLEEEKALVDCSSWTGESRPIIVQDQERILAGSVLKSERSSVRVTAIPPTRKIDHQLEQAEQYLFQREQHQSPLSTLLPKWIWITLSISLLSTIVFWIKGYTLSELSSRSLAVLLISCPCALSIASPSVLHLSLGRLTQLGILLKDPNLLWDLKRAKDLYFDKTGTLTRGTPSITFCSDERYLPQISALEQDQPHPYALAFRNITPDPKLIFAEKKTIIGRGVCGRIMEKNSTKIYRIGSKKWMRELEITIPKEWQHCNIFYAQNQQCVAAIHIEDRLREEVPALFSKLQSEHNIHILSGDQQNNVDRLLKEINPAGGSVTAIGDLDPSQKTAHMKPTESIFVGDGINDAMAMGFAQIGITLNTATSIAQKQADIVLEKDLLGLVALLKEARRATTRIWQNILWAIGYNIIFVPLALIGVLRPQYALLIMLSSSIIIQLNSRR